MRLAIGLIFLVILGVGFFVSPTLESRAPARARVEPHRSPIDVVLLANGRRALTANHTADSVSLVDLQAGKVLAEMSVGRKPSAVACSLDGKRAAVSNLWSGTITLLEIGTDTLKPLQSIPVAGFPRGLVFAPDGKSVYAAIAVRDEVVEIDWAGREIRRSWPAPREPRTVALSPDGLWLVAASSRSGQVRCWNLKTGKRLWQRTIEDAFNLRGLAFTPDGQAILCSHGVRREFPVTKANIEEGWVIDSRVTKLSLQADRVPCSWQMALDTRGLAVGDPQGLAFGGDKYLAIAAGGTHELLLFETAALAWNPGDPGDFLDRELHKGKRFRRLPLGGRPLAVMASADSHTHHAVVANYLADSLQVVDLAKGTIVRTISLGAPSHLTPARKGEALFYDARRSHHQWFSCHTCHVEGHTCGLNFDTLNDDSYGTPKLTPSLYNVGKTGPWTWHGWQKDLGAGVVKSMTSTMFGPRPAREEVADLLAFLDTLTPPPHPRKEGEPAIRRGKELFHGKAACSRCHRPPYYTSPNTYNVKLEADGSPYKLWNPPSLIGLYDRAPYLHDGRAKTLKELLETHHTPQMVGGATLTEGERADLISFLLSL